MTKIRIDYETFDVSHDVDESVDSSGEEIDYYDYFFEKYSRKTIKGGAAKPEDTQEELEAAIQKTRETPLDVSNIIMPQFIYSFLSKNYVTEKKIKGKVLRPKLIQLISDNWPKNQEEYRNGVVSVNIPIEEYPVFTRTALLEEGAEFALKGNYSKRGMDSEGVESRKRIVNANAEAKPARRVDVILYNSMVLAEDDSELPNPIPASWQIVAINGSPTEEKMENQIQTLLCNHYHVMGGTAMNVTCEKFDELLHRSFMYWRNKI